MSYLRFDKTLMTNLGESLPKEILRTNRSGAYHCTTIVDCNTRKYHGSIYINSPGGSVYAGLGIYDTMQFINSDVATICTGMAASMAAVLLVAGTEGKRSALTHSRVMIHQPMGGAQGQASDIEITAREIQKLKKELYTIIADHSHTDFDKVWADSDRDYWMTAQEAKEYGMIDEVLSRKPAAL